MSNYLYRYPYSGLTTSKTQVFVLVESAMGDAAAIGPIDDLGPANDTNAAHTVPAAPVLAKGAIPNTTSHLGSDVGSGGDQRGARAY